MTFEMLGIAAQAYVKKKIKRLAKSVFGLVFQTWKPTAADGSKGRTGKKAVLWYDTSLSDPGVKSTWTS
ncbi:hypothetical protein VM1G_12040 [Cytospora mali]|uniref:Uncharacterized protein n=1 Tax=Cytospora mali TaxID=578113 RepID=A0A194VIU1_CYTMA|nr:hypothetical protein VM1G_12040 [Valsa mali]